MSEMPAQHAHVAPVRLVGEVERPADHRDRSHHGIERDVSDHPREHMAGRAEIARPLDHVGRDQSGRKRACDRYEVDDGIDAEAQARSGNAPARVEQVGEPLQAAERRLAVVDLDSSGEAGGGGRAHFTLTMTQMAWMMPGM